MIEKPQYHRDGFGLWARVRCLLLHSWCEWELTTIIYGRHPHGEERIEYRRCPLCYLVWGCR